MQEPYLLALKGLHVGTLLPKKLIDDMEVAHPEAFASWQPNCLADGRRLAIERYPELYLMLGEKYGPVCDGTFVIPNLVEVPGAKPLTAHDR